MQLQNVSLEDGRNCAILIQLLSRGRWDLSGAEAQQLVNTKQWVAALAGEMAKHLTDKAPAAPKPNDSQVMKITKMGPIGGSTKKLSKKK